MGESQLFQFEIGSGDIWGTLMVPATGEFIRAEDGILKLALYNPATERMDLTELAQMKNLKIVLTIEANADVTTI